MSTRYSRPSQRDIFDVVHLWLLIDILKLIRLIYRNYSFAFLIININSLGKLFLGTCQIHWQFFWIYHCLPDVLEACESVFKFGESIHVNTKLTPNYKQHIWISGNQVNSRKQDTINQSEKTHSTLRASQRILLHLNQIEIYRDR